MHTTLSEHMLRPLHERLARANLGQTVMYPGERAARQPVHTLYGGAHLFTPDSLGKLGELARRNLNEYAPDASTLSAVFRLVPELGQAIYASLVDKLAREPIEDYRIDFEDGYGNRSAAEEDGHAESAAGAVAATLAEERVPPSFGIRIKPFSEDLRERSARTLDIFFTTLTNGARGPLPARPLVTLPKVTSSEQVAVLVDLLDLLEHALGLVPGTIGVELMVETPRAIFDASGRAALPDLIAAAGGRCVGFHFGPYDYTAALNITAAYQRTNHIACDFAREVMQVTLAGTGIWLADGPTTIMPVGPHRATGERSLNPSQLEQNRAVVHRAWALHYEHVRRALELGFYQGWDLHPAQLPARYAAVFAFFREGLASASERLRALVAHSAQATRVRDVFDDAATGQGLLNYFLRAVACGALTEAEALEYGGLTLAELQTRSFLQIVQQRQQ
jgi:citrate lyase beta subunit